MQIPQFERKHDAEKSDDEESKGNHVDHVQCTYCRLPQNEQRTENGKNAESHVSSPIAGAIPFEVHRITGGRETTEHKPKGNEERNDFHADLRVGHEVNADDEVDDTAGKIPAPTGYMLVAYCKKDFKNTTDQHGNTEDTAQGYVTA